MVDLNEAQKNIQKLIDRYNKWKEDSKFMSNEKQACQSLIVPFIRDVLRWDTEDPSEFKTEESRGGKRIDYVVYNQGISQFIVEAKAPSKEIFENYEYYKQALAYGYGKDHDFAILTNFRQIVILACKIQFKFAAEAEIMRIDFLECKESDINVLLCFEKNFWVTHGRNNPLFAKLAHHKARAPVDEQLLEDLKTWRQILLRNIGEKYRLNKFDLSEDEELMRVEEEIQRFIDRLIFICFCEDKELQEPELKFLLSDKKSKYDMKPGFLLGKIQELFTEYRRVYNSDLFDKGECDSFHIDDDKLVIIIQQLREPEGRLSYDFKSIEADILGKTYENFIGHVITGEKRFKEKEDKEKRKKEGIFYTPKYIVDYIVNNTVREYVKDMSFEEINQISIVDPACGSGSFLIRAFDVLVEESAKKLKRELNYEEKRNLMLNCIYGVDLDRRAVQIAKLSLSLRLAERGKPLPKLGENIRHGNSLIDDKEVAGLNAFVWEEEFPEIFKGGGFDVVIGNPPYGYMIDKNEQQFFTNTYKHQDYQKDLYLLFIERYNMLLREKGMLGVIIPNTWLQSVTLKKIRVYLTSSYSWKRILHLPEKVFDAVIDTQVLIFEKDRKGIIDSTNVYIDVRMNNEIGTSHCIGGKFISKDGTMINIVATKESQGLFRRIVKLSKRLVEICDVFNGVKPFEKGKGNPPQTEKSMREKPYVRENEPKPGKEWSPLLRGSLILRYRNLWKNDSWILYGPWLAAPRSPAIFTAPEKIMVRQTGDSIVATLVGAGFIGRNNLHIILPRDKAYDLRFILGIINSKLIEFIYTTMNPEKGEAL
ncbi:MAG TPA: N-6 DNA methylase, partial [Candidatus Nanoarchaeia archaeon]|nr:N-6 DNA methylase [Candidatus Nanoarchaeia archaeon]